MRARGECCVLGASLIGWSKIMVLQGETGAQAVSDPEHTYLALSVRAQKGEYHLAATPPAVGHGVRTLLDVVQFACTDPGIRQLPVRCACHAARRLCGSELFSNEPVVGKYVTRGLQNVRDAIRLKLLTARVAETILVQVGCADSPCPGRAFLANVEVLHGPYGLARGRRRRTGRRLCRW